jgi:hypothetical protein
MNIFNRSFSDNEGRSGYDFSEVFSDGSPNQCLSTVTVGQKISVVTFSTITSSNELATAWVTTISVATSILEIEGIQLNGWNFIPAIKTSRVGLCRGSFGGPTWVAFR